jgi:putative membrane protein
MKHILSDKDLAKLEQQIVETEKLTKTQIVLAAVKQSDAYAEIPWKAFASGVSITGLLMYLVNLRFSFWLSDILTITSIAAPLAAGVFCIILSLLYPAFARLFLSAHRAETETLQFAKSLFLERELFATKTRSGILMLVSHFEKRVVILPDQGLISFMNTEVLQEIISKMTESLAQNKVRLAMETGLDGLIRVLEPSASSRSEKVELSNEIIERDGV